MHVKKDDIPLLAFPKDELWMVFRDQPTLAIVWVESITDFATVEVASGPSDDPLLLTAPTTLTFTQGTIKQLVQLPVGGSPLHTYARIKPTAGRVNVSMAAPSEFRHFMKVLIS